MKTLKSKDPRIWIDSLFHIKLMKKDELPIKQGVMTRLEIFDCIHRAVSCQIEIIFVGMDVDVVHHQVAFQAHFWLPLKYMAYEKALMGQ